MKHTKRFAIPLLVLAVMALFAFSSAKDKGGSYETLPIIHVPGNLAGGFDISWVDSASGRYYLSDRTTTKGTGRVDVIDAKTDQFLFRSEEHTSELQSRRDLVCRLLLEKKK